ncbi:MAG: branched-chain amino acid ABC transporter substrate-binding protein [Rhizobiales bacterium 65-9]|nr:MAG: branched-chain amino acid ABC transporter substrate-binding protein [Rhizobiales bacterium 65-9]
MKQGDLMRHKTSAAAAALSLMLVAAPARAEIVVGFVTGLSGPIASIGIPNSKGIAAGMAYRSEVGGEPIRVIQLDDASDPTAAVRNARKLVEQEKVDFLIGTSGAPQTVAMATVATELKVPMIAISPIAEPAKGDGGPWVVQIPHPQKLLAQGIVADMKRRDVKTVGFIGFSDALGDLMYDSLITAAQEAGVKVVNNERYARTDTSVMPQVLKTIAARPDAIVLGGTATPGALPALALSERGYKGVIYGNNGMISTDFLRVAGKAAEGLICPTGPVAVAEQLPDTNPIKQVALAYRAAYEKANGGKPTDGFSAYAFDGWVVFTDAARRALESGAKPGSPAFKEALRQALMSTKEVVGAHAVYNFTPKSSFGVDDRSRVLVKIEQGGWKLLP